MINIHDIMYAFLALFSIINPFGSAGIFLANTSTATADERHILARKIALYGFMFLVVVILAGNTILTFFGLKLKFVEIGGGLVILVSAWKILMGNANEDNTVDSDSSNIMEKAFVPLTFPFTVGPGVCAVTLGLMAKAVNQENHKLSFFIIGYSEMIIAAFMAMVCIFFVYRYVDKISAVLGTQGTKVAMKLLMFLLLCMGIEMVYDGIVM